MPIPTARSLVQEILLKISDGAEYDLGDIKRHVIQVFSISPQEEKQLLPSGRESVFANRMRNARFMMRKNRLADFPDSRDIISITRQGKASLDTGKRTVTLTSTMPLKEA